MILTEKSYSEWLNYHIQKRKYSRHLPVPDTACYLCRMKKMIMMIAAGIVLTAVPLSAQFNTLMAGTENTDGDISLETGIGDTEGASGMTADAVREVWVRRYLSVCYPLRKMKVNSPYGYRTDPFTGKRRFHNGIDLHARDDEALAMMEGTVLKVGPPSATATSHGFWSAKEHPSARGMRSASPALQGAAPGNTCTSPAGATESMWIRQRFSVT